MQHFILRAPWEVPSSPPQFPLQAQPIQGLVEVGLLSSQDAAGLHQFQLIQLQVVPCLLLHLFDLLSSVFIQQEVLGDGGVEAEVGPTR